jgi:4-amino-4-deoxy-L-arabinose transferase-like glycosyltransferase
VTGGGRLWRRLAAHPLETVFALALLVRLINLALLTGHDAFFAEDDTVGYWALGAALAQPGTFWPTLLCTTDRMPLYPLMLGAVQSAFGDAPRLVALVQAVIDAGTCTLIAALGVLISPRVGLIAGILAAVSVTLIVLSTQILTDTLFLFFFTLMLFAGARFLLRATFGLALLAGLAGGLALATRPAVAVLLAAAVPLVFAIAAAKRRNFGSALAAAALFAIAAAAPVAPVLIRNVVLYDSFSVTSQTGHHLASWIVPLVKQRADGTAYQITVDRMKARYEQRIQSSGRSLSKVDCAGEHEPNLQPNPFWIDAVKRELAWEEMARLPPSAHVKAWLEGMVVTLGAPAVLVDPRVRALPKPSFYNTPGGSLWEKARAYVFDAPGRYQVLLVAGLIAMVPFLVLEAIGFVMLARTLPWAAAFAGGMLGYFLLLNGPVAMPKYRLPMEPALIVLAAIPLARAINPHSGKLDPTAAQED